MADNSSLALGIIATGLAAAGSGGPSEYIKDAAVVDNTLTLTKKDMEIIIRAKDTIQNPYILNILTQLSCFFARI